jgi:hypothetical protein
MTSTERMRRLWRRAVVGAPVGPRLGYSREPTLALPRGLSRAEACLATAVCRASGLAAPLAFAPIWGVCWPAAPHDCSCSRVGAAQAIAMARPQCSDYAQARHAESATIAGLPLANPHVPFVAKALARHVPARTIKVVALGWCDQHAAEGDPRQGRPLRPQVPARQGPPLPRGRARRCQALDLDRALPPAQERRAVPPADRSPRRRAQTQRPGHQSPDRQLEKLGHSVTLQTATAQAGGRILNGGGGASGFS